MIAALLLFVALPVFAQNPDLIPHAQPACGATSAQFQVTRSNTHTEPQVDPGKALIYLVEEQKFRAFRDVTVRVGLDGQWVGATRGASYLSFAVEPGEHHLCVDFLWFHGRSGKNLLLSRSDNGQRLLKRAP
jgi:hypothetical protein